MTLSDLTGIFKKSIATVDSIENPFDDYYLIRLIPAPGITWIPGDHGIFRLLSIPANLNRQSGFT